MRYGNLLIVEGLTLTYIAFYFHVLFGLVEICLIGNDTMSSYFHIRLKLNETIESPQKEYIMNNRKQPFAEHKIKPQL